MRWPVDSLPQQAKLSQWSTLMAPLTQERYPVMWKRSFAALTSPKERGSLKMAVVAISHVYVRSVIIS
jgi:hypothetical protein